MKYIFRITIYAFVLFASATSNSVHSGNTGSAIIPIRWVDGMEGDFSFKDRWSYPEGVFRNEYGQLVCDGFCPAGVEMMYDHNRQILADSLEAYYNMVDTAHYFHSIESEAMVYEWAGTDFIVARQVHNDTVICHTMNNAATHSSLNLIITGNAVTPTIVLNSITPSGRSTFYCSHGEITIDKNLWEQGILKAAFDLKFDDQPLFDMQIYWKGRIYTEIEQD